MTIIINDNVITSYIIIIIINSLYQSVRSKIVNKYVNFPYVRAWSMYMKGTSSPYPAPRLTLLPVTVAKPLLVLLEGN